MWWLVPMSIGVVGGASAALLAVWIERKRWCATKPMPSPLRARLALGAAREGRPLRIVAADSDAATLAELDRLISADPRPATLALVGDRRLRRLVAKRLDEMRPRPNVVLSSVAEKLAHDVVARARLYDQAYWRDHKRVHAVIIGFTALGRACMEEAIFAGIAGELAPPRVTILDPAPGRVTTALHVDMPEIRESIDLDILALDRESIGDHDGGPWTAIRAKAAVTAIFVCVEEEDLRLKIAAALHTLRDVADASLGPIYVLSESGSAASFLFRSAETSGGDLAGRFSAADGLSDRLVGALLDPTKTDLAAQRLHEAYRTAAASKGPADVPWAELGETYREASRHASEHLAQKLWTAGLLWPALTGDPASVTRETYDNVILPCATGSGEDHLMRRLARLEHDRWCAERRLDGWTYGARRDEVRRSHPSLTSFDDPRFPDGEIRKDIDQIRYLFGNVVVVHADGATAPMVIGFNVRADADGVGLAEAKALVEAARWRPVIVLAGLRSADERHVVGEMISWLAQQERAVRVLIVADRTDPRDPDDAELVRRDRGKTALDDDWQDPTSPDATDDQLAAYLARRAHVIVTRL